jgi:hypothetical protein
MASIRKLLLGVHYRNNCWVRRPPPCKKISEGSCYCDRPVRADFERHFSRGGCSLRHDRSCGTRCRDEGSLIRADLPREVCRTARGFLTTGCRGRTTPVAVRTRTATGRPRRRVLKSKRMRRPFKDGSGTGCGAESQQQKQRAEKLHKTRWFRAGQRWRTGCVGHISVLKRRHGLNRCRYRGFEGMPRRVGPGVIADNIIQIGRCLSLQRA